MMRLVPDEGPRSAKIAVIGEAAGAAEAAALRPFVGPSGQMLNEWLQHAGLRRCDVYITNVVPFQPNAKNDIKAVPRAELARWTSALHERLARLEQPVVLVPTGNTALRALIGKAGISRHRGSIYGYQDRAGREIKVIPSLHPAAILRQPAWEKRALADWRRIASDSQFPELRLPAREHMIGPTYEDVVAFVQSCKRNPDDPVALDIETPRKITFLPQPPTKKGKARKPKRVKGARRITCIAASQHPGFSMTIPTTLEYWKQPDLLELVWQQIRLLAGSEHEKVLHNGLYDSFWLLDHGVPLENWRWDTLAMHHALDAADAHSLAHCASIDTRQPFWKDMKDAKDDDDDAGEPDEGGNATFWRYNGIDAAVTRELAGTYSALLDARSLGAFYRRHYERMFNPLLSLMRHGIRVDESARKDRAQELLSSCKAIQSRLGEMAGQPLSGKKDLSNKKVAAFLYEKLKLPTRVDRKTGKVSTKEVILRQLILRKPEVASEPCGLILEHRRKAKLRTFLAESVPDSDSRIRSSYKFTTETGRLASSKNPHGSGLNIQNQDHAVRDVYVPDPGCIFLEVDQSQAESRVVRVLTGDPRMIELARTMPWEFDDHSNTASLIFRKALDAISKLDRFLGKRTNHASNYGQMGKTFSENLLKDTEGEVVRTPEECQAMIDAYLDANPAIRLWQQRTRITVLHDRKLTNSWGRSISWEFDRLTDELYREAYAWRPQSEVGDLNNQLGLIPLAAHLENLRRAEGCIARINAVVHDSLLISTPPQHAWSIYCFALRNMQVPRFYDGVELAIPIEAKLGSSWKMSVEWKKPPTRAAFEEAAWGLLNG